MSDSPDERVVFMHAWRNQKAEWWHTHVDSEGTEVRVNFMSSDQRAIPNCDRYAHYTYVGRVYTTAVMPRGKRDCQLDLVLQVLDHMLSRLVDDVAPWDCFVFFNTAYSNNDVMLRKCWSSYAVANKLDEICAVLARSHWVETNEIDKIRTNMLMWLACCERAGRR